MNSARSCDGKTDTCFCLDGLEEQGIARIKGMKMLSGNGENPGTDAVGVQLDDVGPANNSPPNMVELRTIQLF